MVLAPAIVGHSISVNVCSKYLHLRRATSSIGNGQKLAKFSVDQRRAVGAPQHSQRAHTVDFHAILVNIDTAGNKPPTVM